MRSLSARSCGVRIAVGALSAALMTACFDGGGPAIEGPATPVTGRPVVYVAIGASETAGVGTSDPLTQAWPKVLWREALPEAVLYDLGRPGSTLSEALIEQVGEAERLDPDLVTVWLNVNDLVDQVPVDEYEDALDELLTRLASTTDATVLLANTPRIDALPVYLACRPDPAPDAPDCPAPDVAFPTPSQVRRAVEEYNAAIERAATAEGAIVVDLQEFGEAPTTHPDWIASDGFHPSTEGARVIAQAFADALPAELANAASQPR